MLHPALTLLEIKSLIESGKVSAKEVSEYYKNRIKQLNPSINAVIETFDNAEHGLPILIKDNICQEGKTTSAGSAILKNYSAPYDATVVSRLKEHGIYSLGRTNMDEFAMGGSGEFSHYGPTKNPWKTSLVPGGSSSGSAAAVAAGLAPAALGTETGGSVRQPASFCNLVALYPTYGRNSRFGVIAFASSTDQPGVITRTVKDNAYLQTIIAGNDAKDANSLPNPAQNYLDGLDGKLPDGLRIGVIKDSLVSDGVDAEVKAKLLESIETLKKMGAVIQEVEIPSLSYAIALYFVISRAEAASNLSRYDGTLYGARAQEFKDLADMYLKTRHDGFGNEVKRRIMVGNYVLSAGHIDAYYNKAQAVRKVLRAEFEEAFRNVDVLLSPTTPTPAFEIGSLSHDPLAMYMADYFTVANCIIGTPALNVPNGFNRSGLPLGIQFMGPALSESLLYKVGYAYEQATEYYKQVAPDFA